MDLKYIDPQARVLKYCSRNKSNNQSTTLFCRPPNTSFFAAHFFWQPIVFFVFHNHLISPALASQHILVAHARGRRESREQKRTVVSSATVPIKKRECPFLLSRLENVFCDPVRSCCRESKRCFGLDGSKNNSSGNKQGRSRVIDNKQIYRWNKKNRVFWRFVWPLSVSVVETLIKIVTGYLRDSHTKMI